MDAPTKGRYVKPSGLIVEQQVHERSSALVIGHFGAGNLGDDLMLASITRLLEDHKIRVIIFAKSYDIGDLIPIEAPFCEVLVRGSVLTLLRKLSNVDLVILGGGTHFQDNFRASRYAKSIISMIRFVVLFGASKLMSKKVAWVGVGIGPVQTTFSKVTVKLCAAFTNKISVRDEESFSELERLGITGARLGFDLAALLSEFREQKRDINLDNDLVLGISLFSAPGLRGSGVQQDEFWEKWKDAIEIAFAKTPGLHVKLIVFLKLSGSLGDLDDIHETYARLSRIAPERVEVVPYKSTKGSLEKIAACNRFLAARYHSTVAAGLFGIPMIVAPYDRKVIDVARQLELNELALLKPKRSMSVEDLASLIMRLLEEPELFRPRLTLDAAAFLSKQNSLLIDELLA